MLARVDIACKVNENIPSNALVESRSIVALQLIVRCGVPIKEDGEVVYCLGISMFTISEHAHCDEQFCFSSSYDRLC